MKRLTALSILAISLAFAAPMQASAAANAGVKPGSFFYFFDTVSENISLFFTFNPEQKAKKALAYADERLAEIEAIAEEKNPDAVKTALTNYESNVALATEKSKEVKDKGKAETLLTSIADNTSRNQDALSAVLNKVPEEAKAAITHAIEASKKVQEEATKQIAEIKGKINSLLVTINAVATTTNFNRDCVPVGDGVTKLNEYWAIKNSVSGFEYGSLYDERFCALGASTKNTFKILSSIYAKDEKNIYRFDYELYSGSRAGILDGADYDSFTVINDSFAIDNRKVYFSGFGDILSDILSESDPRYFEALSNRYAKDNRNVYVAFCYEGCDLRKVEADPKTFRVINDIYTADKDNLYCYGKKEYEWEKPGFFVVEGVDLSTFISEPLIRWDTDYGKGPDAHDKYNEYKKCKKYVPNNRVNE